MLKSGILARRTEDKMREQTLAEHSCNTAKLCVYERDVFNISQILYILGQIHDFGKACAAFGRKLDGANISVEHSSSGAVWLLTQAQKEKRFEVKTVLEMLAVAVSCHHTGLVDLADGYTSRLDELLAKLNDTTFLQNYNEMLHNCSDELSEISKIIEGAEFWAESKAVFDALYNLLKNEPSYPANSEEMLFLYLGMFTRWLYSVLIDADRTDAQNFDENTSYTPQNNRENFEKIVKNLDNRTYPQNELNAIRGEIYNKCAKMSASGAGLFELNVPTGGGKTLSGFRFALGNALANNLKRIIYVVPFISIIEQNAQVIRSVLKEIGCENMLIESHSNVVRYNENDINSKFDKFFTNWDEPIIFTTMVGFLESVYCGKTQNNRRFHNLANSVIIFDEVQALPKRCVGMFNLLVKFLQNALHSTILLCSATQPTLSQLSVFSTNKEAVKMLCLGASQPIIDKEYPTLTRTQITFDDDETFDKERAVNYILKRFENTRNLLVIVNTKRAARELFLELKKSAKCFHLSNNMCAAHRLETIDEIKKILKTDEHFILVSTQLIEAGVDLDFECVIRSRCGVDSLIQSAGRCNREGRLVDGNGNKRLGNVFVIRLDNNLENLNSLDDIAKAQGYFVTCKMRHEDITSKASIDDYFHQVYDDVSSLKYKIKNTNLVDELSGKTCELDKKNIFKLLRTNFKTVADNFSVIEERNMVSVLVPYKAGEELIKNISKLDKKDAKKCQRYTVEVSANKIKNFTKYDDKTGIWYCVGSYDSELGLLDEAPDIEFEGGFLL